MTSRLFAAAAAATLALAACGGGGGVQDEVADMVIDDMADEGLDIDEGCVRDATGDLSDDDAEKILEAGPTGDPAEISDDAAAVADAVVGCVDTDAVVDRMIDEMVAEMGEENVDVDCIRDATEGLDLATLDEGGEEVFGAIFECIEIDLGG